jgi:hypothetical protein
MVLMDDFSDQTQINHFLVEKVEEEGIVVIMISAGTTDSLKPLDASTNKVSKKFLSETF